MEKTLMNSKDLEKNIDTNLDAKIEKDFQKNKKIKKFRAARPCRKRTEGYIKNAQKTACMHW